MTLTDLRRGDIVAAVPHTHSYPSDAEFDRDEHDVEVDAIAKSACVAQQFDLALVGKVGLGHEGRSASAARGSFGCGEAGRVVRVLERVVRPSERCDVIGVDYVEHRRRVEPPFVESVLAGAVRADDDVENRVGHRSVVVAASPAWRRTTLPPSSSSTKSRPAVAKSAARSSPARRASIRSVHAARMTAWSNGPTSS